MLEDEHAQRSVTDESDRINASLVCVFIISSVVSCGTKRWNCGVENT